MMENARSDASPSSSEESSLRIALLSYRGDPYVGGFGVYVRYLSRALSRLGHSVDVIAAPPYPFVDPDVNLIKIPSLRPYEGTHFLEGVSWKNLISLTDLMELWGAATGAFPLPYTFGRRVARFFRRRSPSYDIIHDNYGLYPGLRDLRRQGFPVVTTIHHPVTRDRDIALEAADSLLDRIIIHRWYSYVNMQKKIARELPRHITVTRQARDDLQDDYGLDSERLEVIPYGIDTELFRPREDIDRDPNRLMAVSSANWLRQTKGIGVLLEAFRKLTQQYEDLTLVVVGSPDPGGKTELYLMEMGIGDRVTFVEDVPHDKMARLYARSSIAVVPSSYEGFGFPAAEAMACGTPVVSTTAGGLPEVVGDAGILIEPDDSDALYRGIRRLREDETLRQQYGQRGRRRVVNTFNWNRSARRTAEVYRDVIRLEDD